MHTVPHRTLLISGALAVGYCLVDNTNAVYLRIIRLSKTANARQRYDSGNNEKVLVKLAGGYFNTRSHVFLLHCRTLLTNPNRQLHLTDLLLHKHRIIRFT